MRACFKTSLLVVITLFDLFVPLLIQVYLLELLKVNSLPPRNGHVSI